MTNHFEVSLLAVAASWPHACFQEFYWLQLLVDSALRGQNGNKNISRCDYPVAMANQQEFRDLKDRGS